MNFPAQVEDDSLLSNSDRQRIQQRIIIGDEAFGLLVEQGLMRHTEDVHHLGLSRGEFLAIYIPAMCKILEQ